MEQMQINCDHNTKHVGLVEQTANIVAAIKPKVSTLIEAASLNDFKVTIRLTDHFVAEVDAYGDARYPNYTTERVGGSVAAITLSQYVAQGNPLILVNSTIFTGKDPLVILYLPMTLGHELAHCIIGQIRAQYGFPHGHCPEPTNLIETICNTAISVCDEFFADALMESLFPSIELKINTDSDETRIAARTVIAYDRLNRMHHDLDMHVYPAWRDAVQQYRMRLKSLNDMTTGLVKAIKSGLILSAHYRAAITYLSDDLDKVRQIEEHPGMRLYLTPFWNRVGSILDTHVQNLHLRRFPDGDQEVFDTATEAVREIWTALGITFELLSSGQVYVHVDEPLE